MLQHVIVVTLIAATRKGQRDVVAVLLQHGADVSPVSLDTKLHGFIEGGSLSIVYTLL